MSQDLYRGALDEDLRPLSALLWQQRIRIAWSRKTAQVCSWRCEPTLTRARRCSGAGVRANCA
jgi:hypothetical protein